MLLSSIAHSNALVVGATQGIGLEFIRQVLQDERMDHVFATYRSQETAAQLFALAEQYAERLHCIPMDITDESQIETGILQIRAIAPNLHFVINCVGLLHNE